MPAVAKSDYWENKVLDILFGATAFTAPATLYFALFTAAPTDAGGGTEVTGGAYARAAVTNNSANFPAASGGAKTNANAITWPQATASWGTVVAIGIFDAASGGNFLYWGTVTTPRAVPSGDTPRIPAGDLVITED